jgi:hypothetical protein
MDLLNSIKYKNTVYIDRYKFHIKVQNIIKHNKIDILSEIITYPLIKNIFINYIDNCNENLILQAYKLKHIEIFRILFNNNIFIDTHIIKLSIILLQQNDFPLLYYIFENIPSRVVLAQDINKIHKNNTHNKIINRIIERINTNLVDKKVDKIPNNTTISKKVDKIQNIDEDKKYIDLINKTTHQLDICDYLFAIDDVIDENKLYFNKNPLVIYDTVLTKHLNNHYFPQHKCNSNINEMLINISKQDRDAVKAWLLALIHEVCIFLLSRRNAINVYIINKTIYYTKNNTKMVDELDKHLFTVIDKNIIDKQVYKIISNPINIENITKNVKSSNKLELYIWNHDMYQEYSLLKLLLYKSRTINIKNKRIIIT